MLKIAHIAGTVGASALDHPAAANHDILYIVALTTCALAVALIIGVFRVRRV
jgi:hypothetical protein